MAAAAGGSVVGVGGGYGIYCGGGSNVGVSLSMSAGSSSSCLSPPYTCLQQQQQHQKPLDGGGGFFTSAAVGGSSSAPFIAGTSMVSFEPARAGTKRPATTTDLNPPTNNFFNDCWLDDSTGCFGAGDEDDFDEYFHLHPSSSSKKRRLTSDQVRFLERSFEVENKLEPERKVQLAKDLGMQPRQVAIWFQNRRARWKNKRLEKDFECLQSRFCELKGEFESLLKEKDQLEAQVVQLSGKLHSGKLHGKGTVKLLADDHDHEPEAAGQYCRESETSDSDNRFRTSSTDPAAVGAVVAFDTSSASEAESTTSCQQQQPSMTFLISPDLTAACDAFETSTAAAAESPLSYVDHCSHHLVVADFLSHDHHCYAAIAAAAFQPADGSDVSDQDKVDGGGGFNDDDVVVDFDHYRNHHHGASQFGVRAVVVEEDTAEEEDDHRPPWIWSY